MNGSPLVGCENFDQVREISFSILILENFLKSSNSIVTEYVSCDLCGSEEHTFLYSKWDPVTRKEYNLVECRCGMAFVNPMPTVESIPFLYPPDYLKDKRAFARLYSRMMKLLPNISGGRLLDIGCGQGDFISRASQEGWFVEGVDLMAWDNPDLLPIKIGDFLEMDLPWESYDVLTAWALLEHVRRPSAFFRKVVRLLKKDGKVYIRGSEFQSSGNEAQLYGRHSSTFMAFQSTRY